MNKDEAVQVGDYIKLIEMPDDPDPIISGSCGYVDRVQRLGRDVQIGVRWDSGRTLSLIVPPDVFELVAKARE